jgi:hypothetical protein
VQLKCVLSAQAKIAAILDMYRNFFALLVWHRHSCLCDVWIGAVVPGALFRVLGWTTALGDEFSY